MACRISKRCNAIDGDYCYHYGEMVTAIITLKKCLVFSCDSDSDSDSDNHNKDIDREMVVIVVSVVDK